MIMEKYTNILEIKTLEWRQCAMEATETELISILLISLDIFFQFSFLFICIYIEMFISHSLESSWSIAFSAIAKTNSNHFF